MKSGKHLGAHGAACVALLVILAGVLAGCAHGVPLQPGRRTLLFPGRARCSDRNFAAVQECARRDARIDLDPQDQGDTSRHWQLVAAPGGTLRIQSVLRSASRSACASLVTAAASCTVNTLSLGAAASTLNAWKIDCSSPGKGCTAFLPARNRCPKRYLGYSTACGVPYMALFRLDEPGAITRFDARAPARAPPPPPTKRPPPPKRSPLLPPPKRSPPPPLPAMALELMLPAGLGPALQGSPPGASASVLDISINYIGETYVAVADPVNGYPMVYKRRDSPSLGWDLVGGGYAVSMPVDRLWLFNAFMIGSGDPHLAFLTTQPTRQLVYRAFSSGAWVYAAENLNVADAVWEVAPSVAMATDKDDRLMAAVQVADASGEGIAVYSVAHFPGSLPAWSAYTDSQGARLLLPSPGRSPFVLDAARATDPEGAAAYLATTSSPSNPGCLAVRQLKNGTQGAVWVAPGGDASNPPCIADLLPTDPAPGTKPIPAPVPDLLASGDDRDSPDALYLAYRDTDGAVRVVTASYTTFSSAQWKPLGRARVTGALPTSAAPQLAVDSDGVPFVGTLLGGEQGASVYRFSGEDWQLASSPGSLKAHSTLRLAAGFYYNSFSYPVPLRAAFDDASNSYKTSVWRLDGRDT